LLMHMPIVQSLTMAGDDGWAIAVLLEVLDTC